MKRARSGGEICEWQITSPWANEDRAIVRPTSCARSPATTSPALSAPLSDWPGRITPHLLRHFCASQLYGSGMDLVAASPRGRLISSIGLPNQVRICSRWTTSPAIVPSASPAAARASTNPASW